MPERPDRSHQVLVAVAHGSADPRAAATVTDLMALAAQRAADRGLSLPEVRTAYLGHAAPSLPQVMGAIGRADVTVLPLLLTPAYHSKTDIPRVLARLGGGFPVSYGGTLGPHPLLLSALERRLGEADPLGPAGPARRARTGVVLAAAGSTDPEANIIVARLAAQWQARAGWFEVRAAAAASGAPTPAEAVTGLLHAGAGRVLVATYLLAPGLFADRIRASALAAGAAAVAPALGALPEVAEVFLDRYQEAATLRRRAA
ncbi:MAG TPA: sirohydrochlorin chelatase [Streptosporangiaceae bacterium]